MVWRYACGLDKILRLFLLLFCKLNLAIFGTLSIPMRMDRGYLVGATPPSVFYRFFGNFIGVLVIVWRYACGLDIILRLILSYKTFSLTFITFQHFRLQSYQYLINVYIHVVPLSAMLLQFYKILYETSVCAYAMAWRYAYALDKILKFWFCFLSCELKLFHDTYVVHIEKNWQGHKFSEFACFFLMLNRNYFQHIPT